MSRKMISILLAAVLLIGLASGGTVLAEEGATQVSESEQIRASVQHSMVVGDSYTVKASSGATMILLSVGSDQEIGIVAEGDCEFTLAILNIHGDKVKSFSSQGNAADGTMNVKTGDYLMELKGNGGSGQVKIRVMTSGRYKDWKAEQESASKPAEEVAETVPEAPAETPEQMDEPAPEVKEENVPEVKEEAETVPETREENTEAAEEAPEVKEEQPENIAEADAETADQEPETEASVEEKTAETTDAVPETVSESTAETDGQAAEENSLAEKVADDGHETEDGELNPEDGTETDRIPEMETDAEVPEEDEVTEETGTEETGAETDTGEAEETAEEETAETEETEADETEVNEEEETEDAETEEAGTEEAEAGEPEEAEDGFMLPEDRTVRFDIEWEGKDAGVGLKLGDTATFVAQLEGYDELEYDLQWQESADNENWNDIEGATDETMEMVVDESNFMLYWRLTVNIHVPAAE